MFFKQYFAKLEMPEPHTIALAIIGTISIVNLVQMTRLNKTGFLVFDQIRQLDYCVLTKFRVGHRYCGIPVLTL